MGQEFTYGGQGASSFLLWAMAETVPTTMPGAFFWKNKGFEQHARDIGLADMPQTGVASEH